MKHRAHHPEDTTFMQRTGDFSRRHWAAAVVASVMGTLTGSVIPMVEQWHSDKVAGEQIKAIYEKFEANEKRQNADEQRLAKLEQKDEDLKPPRKPIKP